MPRKSTCDSDFVTWKGEKIENEGVDCYSQCVVNEFALSIGDFVYIDNPDQPIRNRKFNIARIIKFYEIIDPLCTDFKYQAVVVPYQRLPSIAEEVTNVFPDLDWDREVICEPSECRVPLSSVRGKCEVMFCNGNETLPNNRHVYICRYKIVNKNGTLSLVAVDERELTVSPIKIVNQNSVQKVSKLNEPDSGGKMFSASDSELDESPAKSFRSTAGNRNSFGARRNLNSSLNDAAGGNVWVGSIVLTPHRKKDDLKMTIKVTRKESSTNSTEKSNTPLKAIQYNNNELDNLSKRQSAMKLTNSYTPTTKTPSKRAQFGTPNQENNVGTPKSILKPVSVRLTRETPRRNITFAERMKTRSPQQSTLASTTDDNMSTTPLRRSKRRSSTCPGSMVELNDSLIFNDSMETPEKPNRKTPSKTPNKSASKTAKPAANKTPKKTPSHSAHGRCIDMNVNDCNDSANSLNETVDDETTVTPPKRARKTPSKTPSKTPTKTPSKTPSRKTRITALTPALAERKIPIVRDSSDIQLVKESLHVSAVPKTLPCRENEYRDVYKFIEGKLLDESGGCMYVSGVPGTGKTATVTEVIRVLQAQAKQKKLPKFDFVEINGMRLTDPRQAYVQIYQQLSGDKVTSEQAQCLLDRRFTTPSLHRKTTVILVDELDILCNRRQDVIYNILDWPTKKDARLVVITIANTMDLPERVLMGRVTSRLGLTRLTFQPYTHKQLQEVVQARLIGTNIFESDAVQLAARKVASISGDCRRALDICRRSTEIAESECSGKQITVSMLHVQKAITEMITNPKVRAIKGCSKYEKFFLQAVQAEVMRTGVDETVLSQVYHQLEPICALNGVIVPEPGIALRISCRLGASRLLICGDSSEFIHQKIMLNVTTDDIYYALHVNNDD